MEWRYPLTHYILRKVSAPIARYLIPTWIGPNTMTVIGFLIGLSGIILILTNQIALALVLLITSLILDVVDGDVARLRRSATKEGAFLDSLFDRIVDSALVLVLVMSDPLTLAVPGILIASGAVIVSYVRKQAEAMGIECKVGVATRDIRLLVLLAAIFLSFFVPQVIYYAFILLTVLIYSTVAHRAIHTYSQMKKLSPAE